VFEHRFERSAGVAAPAELARRFFADGEAWFRLNPEWEVLALDADSLRVRYERSEADAEYHRTASADFSLAGGAIILDGPPARTIAIALTEVDADNTRIDWREAFDTPIEDARRAELNLWFDAALGYLAIAARPDRRGRSMRWLLDRVWLRMSPTARRVGLLIVGMEALALLLFIAVLIVYRLLD
jgi:hypothetical protein